MKITVWTEPHDDYTLRTYDTIEVQDNANEELIEQAAREVVVKHIEWGYYKTEGHDV